MVNLKSRNSGDKRHCGYSMLECDVVVETLPAVTSRVYTSLYVLRPLQIKQCLHCCFFDELSLILFNECSRCPAAVGRSHRAPWSG